MKINMEVKNIDEELVVFIIHHYRKVSFKALTIYSMVDLEYDEFYEGNDMHEVNNKVYSRINDNSINNKNFRFSNAYSANNRANLLIF